MCSREREKQIKSKGYEMSSKNKKFFVCIALHNSTFCVRVYEEHQRQLSSELIRLAFEYGKILFYYTCRLRQTTKTVTER